jgi:hypothetical protein
VFICLLDIDECSLKRDGCEQSCRNSPGNFSCLCSQGYVLSNNGKNCTDIDECERFTNCQQVCVNSLGSYQCSCSDGYVLQADGVTCVGMHHLYNVWLLELNHCFGSKYLL